MDDHLVPLGGDWSLRRDFAVRSAGFSVAGLDAFGSHDETARLREIAADPAFREAVTWQNRDYGPNRLGFGLVDEREIALRDALYHDVLGERPQRPERSPAEAIPRHLVARFANRQHAAGTRRVHQREHARSRAGTGDAHHLQDKRDGKESHEEGPPAE